MEKAKHTLKDTVLITGIGGPAGKASAKFFYEKGYKIIGTDIHPADFKYGKIIVVPNGVDPEFPQEIIKIIGREKPGLFIPTVTEELPACSKLKNKILDIGTKLFISEPELAKVLNDKYLMSERLELAGLPTPKTYLPLQLINSANAGESLGYPYIVKPRQGRGGRGVTIIDSKDQTVELEQENIIYQEFEDGQEFDVNLFVYPAGIVQSAVVLWKSEMKGGIIGNAVKVQRIKEDSVKSIALAAARKLMLEGPLDIDIRLNGKGYPVILEINGRVGANLLEAREVFESLESAFKQNKFSQIFETKVLSN